MKFLNPHNMIIDFSQFDSSWKEPSGVCFQDKKFELLSEEYKIYWDGKDGLWKRLYGVNRMALVGLIDQKVEK